MLTTSNNILAARLVRVHMACHRLSGGFNLIFFVKQVELLSVYLLQLDTSQPASPFLWNVGIKVGAHSQSFFLIDDLLKFVSDPSGLLCVVALSSPQANKMQMKLAD